MQNLHEAKNMPLKAEFILQDRGRYDSSRKNYEDENSWALVDKEVAVRETKPRNDRFKEYKAVGKQKVAYTKEALKAANLYAWPTLGKCFKCNQLGHRSSYYSLRRAAYLAERDEEHEDEVCCEPDGDEEDEEDYDEDDDGRNYMVRKLMLISKQEENTQRHQLF